MISPSHRGICPSPLETKPADHYYTNQDCHLGNRSAGEEERVSVKGPYGCHLVKLVADIPLKLRQITTLPAVELQLFVEIDLLNNLLSTRVQLLQTAMVRKKME